MPPSVLSKKPPILSALALALLLLYFAQGMAQARRASITFDEGPHLATGYATLRTGDFRIQPVHIHPPLANMLSAAPLLFQQDLPDPRTIDGWEIASLSAVTQAIVWQYPEPARIAVAGRIPILLLGMLLGALVFRWAADRGGRWAGLLALAFFAVDPNLIAHGALITTDMAATALGIATLYALERARRRPTHGRLLLTGVLLGLAQLAKVSSLILVPIVGFVLAVRWWNRRPRPAWTAGLWTVALPLIVAFGVLEAGYAFRAVAVAPLPFPLPGGTHALIYRSLQEHYQLGHPTFLLGQVGDHGWIQYFPIAFALKTPLPVLALLIGAAIARTIPWITRRPAPRIRQFTGWIGAPLWLFPVLYTASSLFSSVNIGYRHLLPLLPCLYIITAPILTAVTRHPVPQRGLLGLLWLWAAAGTLRVSPYPLTFFNELAGGPENGYRALVDSNLDWGQNLWDLRAWLDAHGETQIYYAHYSPADPRVYGIAAEFLPPDPRATGDFRPWSPGPGLYAIGATVLQGPYAPDSNTFAWFRSHTPIARLGQALFIYRVEPQPSPAWAALCTASDPLPTAQPLSALLGRPDLRIVTPDCARGWVYPQGGRTAGLYFPPPGSIPPPGAVLEFSVRTPEGSERPVYRIPARPDLPTDPEVQIDGPLIYRGHRVLSAEDTFWAYWEVRELPARPLSLLAHRRDPSGAPPAVDDGLCLPIEQWQVGDWLIQRHRFPEDAAHAADPIDAGGYWLDTLERWPVHFSDGSTGDIIPIR